MRYKEPECQSEYARYDAMRSKCRSTLRDGLAAPNAIWAGRTTCDFSQTCQDGRCVAQCSNLCVPANGGAPPGEVVEHCVDNGGCAV